MIPRNPALVTFGQLKDPVGGDNLERGAFIGKLTRFSIWLKMLAEKDIKNFNLCKNIDQNSIIQWDSTSNNLILNESVSLISIPFSEVCRADGKYRTLISPPLHLPVAESICKLLGGRLIFEGDISEANFTADEKKLLALYKNDEEVALNLQNNLQAKDTINYKKNKWKQANKLISRSQEEKSKYQKQSPLKNKKTEKRKKRQATFSSAAEYNFSLESELRFTATCEFSEPPVFRAMGYCSDLENLLEEQYILQSHTEERPLFQGFTGKSITYANKFWVAKSSLR